MPLLPSWLRRGAEMQEQPSSPVPQRRQAPSAVALRAAAPRAEAIAVDASALVPGWRPDEGRLVLDLAQPVGPGRRVALRLVGDVGVSAPLLGTVASARGGAAGCTAEIQVDAEQQPALRRVIAFLHGRAPKPRARPPRFKLALPAVISAGAAQVYMKTLSLSQGGCSLAWTGRPPPVGAMVGVRVGGQDRAAALRGRVCWVRPEPAGVRVGVRFLVGGDEAALASILAEARHPDVET